MKMIIMEIGEDKIEGEEEAMKMNIERIELRESKYKFPHLKGKMIKKKEGKNNYKYFFSDCADVVVFSIQQFGEEFLIRNINNTYLEWEMKIEQLFACHNYIKEKKLKVATMEFTDYALLVEPIAKREDKIWRFIGEYLEEIDEKEVCPIPFS